MGGSLLKSSRKWTGHVIPIEIQFSDEEDDEALHFSEIHDGIYSGNVSIVARPYNDGDTMASFASGFTCRLPGPQARRPEWMDSELNYCGRCGPCIAKVHIHRRESNLPEGVPFGR